MGKKLKGLQQLSIFEWVEDSSSSIADTFLSLSIFYDCLLFSSLCKHFEAKQLLGKMHLLLIWAIKQFGRKPQCHCLSSLSVDSWVNLKIKGYRHQHRGNVHTSHPADAGLNLTACQNIKPVFWWKLAILDAHSLTRKSRAQLSKKKIVGSNLGPSKVNL